MLHILVRIFDNKSAVFKLTVEVEEGFGGDWCGSEHQHLQTFQALSANLCCHLLVDFTHMIQLQHLQAHAVPRWCRWEIEGDEWRWENTEIEKIGEWWDKRKQKRLQLCIQACFTSQPIVLEMQMNIEKHLLPYITIILFYQLCPLSVSAYVIAVMNQKAV